MNDSLQKAQTVIHEIKKVIVGKDDIVKKVLIAILAKGHILLEGIPGVGKTTLALSFSKALSLSHNRIQCTPDIMPTDITGFSIYNKINNKFEYKPGAVMCNLLLADEINRTSSKTQSALLEVMEENKVSVDGRTYLLPQPFIVIATQNPIGFIGTNSLPESQLDRFMIKLTMGYPDIQSEINILKGKNNSNGINQIVPVLTSEEIIQIQNTIDQIYVHDKIYEYIALIAAKSRNHPMIRLGISPRGAIALTRMSKATAFLENRNFVIPDDIIEILPDVVTHRIILSPKAKLNSLTEKDVLNNIIENTPMPYNTK